MATVKVLKDHVTQSRGPLKAGTVVSLPFGMFRELERSGIVEAVATTPAKTTKPSEIDGLKAEIARLSTERADLLKANDELADQVEKLQAEKVALEKKVADLEKPKK